MGTVASGGLLLRRGRRRLGPPPPGSSSQCLRTECLEARLCLWTCRMEAEALIVRLGSYVVHAGIGRVSANELAVRIQHW